MKLETEFGTEEIQLEVEQYLHNGNLCISMYYKEDGEWLPYGELTTNLPTRLPPYCGYVDTNNLSGVIDFIEKYGLGQNTGLEAQSGFCRYPMYLFDAEKLRELCPEGMAEYERNLGISKDKQQKEKSR